MIQTRPFTTPMKSKLLLSLLLSLGFLTAPVSAEDAEAHVYRSEVAGIMCSACVAKIKSAFATMEGVSSVKVTAGKDGAAPSVEIVSTSGGLTQKDAVKALGEDAKTFVVQTFERAD